MINSSREIIDDLVSFGVDFSKNADGSFNYTKEGAHSTNRILFHKDITGKEITSKLLAEVTPIVELGGDFCFSSGLFIPLQ